MSYSKNDILTLNNGKEYIIVEILELENNRYLYMIENAEESDDCVLMKEVKKDNTIILENIENEEEFDKVLLLLSKNSKEDIEELLEN